MGKIACRFAPADASSSDERNGAHSRSWRQPPLPPAADFGTQTLTQNSEHSLLKIMLISYSLSGFFQVLSPDKVTDRRH